MQMIESTTNPLGINTNKENILYPHETNPLPPNTVFREGFLFPDEPSSTPLGSLNINNDENEYPLEPPLFASRQSSPKTFKTDNEMASLRAELEATRRKLAEYEGLSNKVPQPLKSITPSRSPVTSTTSSSFDYGYNDIMPWSDYGSSASEVPSAPRPLPMDFAPPVPPLRIPSASIPGQSGPQGSTVTPGSSMLPLREDNRSFSLPIPGPIGEPRKLPPPRAFSGDYKTIREKEVWKPEPEWTPWPGVPVINPPRQLTGAASLGIVFNDQQPWPDTFVGSSAGVPRYPLPEQYDWRRLLDRSMSCNWNTVIEKVIVQSDQQASLFLQQKLKLATPVQKHEIVDTIVRHSHPLMINRFGNFLVQRCFEYGTKDQIDRISTAIRGNVVNLSMDMFGCHVVQKAFDCVDEEVKVAMVKELLCRIPETVSHRFACHVWQKLLEIRWKGPAPVIMKYVNDALRGLWTEIALGETGSLVVQNIFENCLDDDKRPCIEEILENVDTIARGQWGNWVIQHIVEHGHPDDRLRTLDIILAYSAVYSTDQFASKVIEKALKCCGPEIFQSYIAKIVEKEPGRPRVALIDISSDIYGNYLIQYVLQHGPPCVREQISFHVRKHMVSLRGSRYGQRVAFQVERLRTAGQKSGVNWPQQGRWD